ncbi:MAG: arylsulfatase [Planctomycetes bacterium]|nr:arylsulfatase [Planctomycetota bacterium]
MPTITRMELHVLTLIALASATAAAEGPARRPNVVVILADDLGYGDVRCYNPDRGKIPTPNIDRLAAEGMRFTDGHSSSGVCSPSRYTLLTGRYHWRTRLQAGIVNVFGKPLIAPDRLTVAGLLAQEGYRTACIGKWHLGWDWPIPEGRADLFHAKPPDGRSEPPEDQAALWREVFSRPVLGGPTARGFGSYFGTDVPNWPPFCFIDGDRTVGVPSRFLPPELLRDNLASLQGPALAGWRLEPILPTLRDRACEFIERSARARAPFFLYLPLTSPHTPLAVNEEWRGRSGLNRYADFVMETDAVVGRVLDALDASGAADETLVLFTSDNGCAPYIGVDELEEKGHFPSGPLRGYKSDVWEGGHRVPFIVRWPEAVKAAAVCGRLVQHADLLATCAEILGATLPDGAGEDSTSVLPLLDGGDAPVREVAVNQSSGGLLAIRKGRWKLVFGPGSGGWGRGRDDHPAQLYDLSADIGETRNLYAERPDVVADLTAAMEKIVADGRSTPGAPQKNDVPVKWRRFLDAAGEAQKAAAGKTGP